MKVAVLGAGAWGSALAIALCDKHAVSLWGRDAARMELLVREHCNRCYLPGVVIPASVNVTAQLAGALSNVELILI